MKEYEETKMNLNITKYIGAAALAGGILGVAYVYLTLTLIKIHEEMYQKGVIHGIESAQMGQTVDGAKAYFYTSERQK